VSVTFGYAKRPRGRHVPLRAAPDQRRPIVPASPEGEAAQVFAALRRHLAQLPVGEDIETTSSPNDTASVVVVCGDPECEGDDGTGRWIAFRGRCPKCGGYAAALGEIAKLREGFGGSR